MSSTSVVITAATNADATTTATASSNTSKQVNETVVTASSPPLIRRLSNTGPGKPVIVQLKIELQSNAGDASGSTIAKSASVAAKVTTSVSSTTTSSSGITVQRRNNCCVISIPRSAVKTVPSNSSSLATPGSTIRVAAAKRLSDSVGGQVRALVAAQEGFSVYGGSPTKQAPLRANQDSAELPEEEANPISAHEALQAALVLLPQGTRKRFQCRLCGNCYARVEYLSRHVRQAHLRDPRLLTPDSPRRRSDSGSQAEVLPEGEPDGEADDENNGAEAASPKKRRRLLLLQTEAAATAQAGDDSGPRCTLCDRRFANADELKRHLLSHPGSYECPRCGRWFPSLSGLQRHSAEAHASLDDDYGEGDDDDEEEEEGVQGEEVDGDELLNDGNTAAAEMGTGCSPLNSFSRPCVCALCQATFSESHLLANHVKSVHRLRKTGGRGDKRCYQCAYCAKCFHQHTNLRRHLTCHTGQRQFACPICQKRFADRGDVNKHMVTHTGVRPFKCQVCGRRFGQRTNLRTHALTHTKPQLQQQPHQQQQQQQHHLESGLALTFRRRLAADGVRPVLTVLGRRQQQQQHRIVSPRAPMITTGIQDRLAYIDTIEVPEADEEVILG